MSLRSRLRLVVGSSLILWAISERMFWSFWRPDEHVLEVGLTLVMYMLATYCMLLGIQYFRISSLPGMVAAGALYGWITEGVIAMTIFGPGGIPLPFSISWTGLAWHMPLSVIAGWWWYHHALHTSWWVSVRYASIAGLLWGIWSMTWFFEAVPIITTVGAYAAHAFTLTTLMIIGHYLMQVKVAAFQASRIETLIIVGLVLTFFVGITIPTVGTMAVILVLLFGVLGWMGYQSRRQCREPAILVSLTAPVSVKNLLTMYLMPLIATVFYALMVSGYMPLFPVNYLVLISTTIGGFVLLVWAIQQIRIRSY